jgi:hypothetical protein
MARERFDDVHDHLSLGQSGAGPRVPHVSGDRDGVDARRAMTSIGLEHVTQK